MEFDTKKENGILIVKPLSKSIDVSTSTVFKGMMIDLIKNGNKQFLLNLSNVEFMDSSGLGAVISLMKTLAACEGNFVICEPKHALISLFALTRMNRILEIYSSEKDAIQTMEKA